MPGTLFVVATPIGNLDDITLRALRVLREVAIIAAEDTRRTGHLLLRHGIATPTTSLHEHNERQKTPALVARLQAGESVALVSDAGTPTISDPGTALIQAAIDAEIRVEPIPGPNAAIAAVAASGLAFESFTFMGFPPVRSKDRKSWFARLRALPGVIVFYEAPHRLDRTLQEVIETIGDRPGLVARELTKVHEELVRGPISALSGRLRSHKGEFTVVIGEVPSHGQPALIGRTTDIDAMTRRRRLADVAKEYGVSPNKLYAAIAALVKVGHTTD